MRGSRCLHGTDNRQSTDYQRGTEHLHGNDYLHGNEYMNGNDYPHGNDYLHSNDYLHGYDYLHGTKYLHVLKSRTVVVAADDGNERSDQKQCELDPHHRDTRPTSPRNTQANGYFTLADQHPLNVGVDRALEQLTVDRNWPNDIYSDRKCDERTI